MLLHKKNFRALIVLLIITLLFLGTVMQVVATNSAESDGEIGFIIDPDLVKPPYDPDFPADLLPPDDGHNVRPIGGPIHLQVVPAFNFGQHILGPDMPDTFNHIPPSDPLRPHLVMVWDHRHIMEEGTGMPTGWRVYVEKTSQFVHSNQTNVLAGAEIRFSDSRNSGTGGLGGSTAPSQLGGAGSLAFNALTMEGNRLFIGGALAGEGGWNTHIEFGRQGSDILLHVPASADMILGTYRADVLWTLTVASPYMGE